MNSNTGENILNAIRVVTKTHENVDKLLRYCQNLSKENGNNYEFLTEKFLRWKSDSNFYGWLITSFILLFKRQDDVNNTIYGIEINLDEVKLNVVKYVYNDAVDFEKYISPAEHWKYYYPIHNEENDFAQIENENYVESTPISTENKYDLICVVFKKFPLVEITADNVQEKIFGTFDELAAM